MFCIGTYLVARILMWDEAVRMALISALSTQGLVVNVARDPKTMRPICLLFGLDPELSSRTYRKLAFSILFDIEGVSVWFGREAPERVGLLDWYQIKSISLSEFSDSPRNAPTIVMEISREGSSTTLPLLLIGDWHNRMSRNTVNNVITQAREIRRNSENLSK